MSEWRDISTAPRNGRRLILWLADEGFATVASYRNMDGWEGFWIWEMDYGADHHYPTHWMPFPPAPPAAMKDGGE